MCDPEFPFSAFWKWYITRDVDLSKIVGNAFKALTPALSHREGASFDLMPV